MVAEDRIKTILVGLTQYGRNNASVVDVIIAIIIHLALLAMVSHGSGERDYGLQPATRRYLARAGRGVMRVTAVNSTGGMARYRTVAPATHKHLVATAATAATAATVRSSGSKPAANPSKVAQSAAKNNPLNQHLDRYREAKIAKSVNKTNKTNKPTTPSERKSVSTQSAVRSAASAPPSSKAAAPVPAMSTATIAVANSGAKNPPLNTAGDNSVSVNNQYTGGYGGGVDGLLGDSGTDGELVDPIVEAQQQIMQTIAYFWQPPEGIAAGQYCCYLAQVNRQGEITKLQLEKHSGNLALNASAKAAIQQAEPLPLPEAEDLYHQFKQLRLVFRGDGSLGNR